MRHKYETRCVVLSRTPLGEANTLLTLITEDLGLVRARAQGLRQPGAKLAAALTTFAESQVVLVRGKEGWRIAGAILDQNWFTQMPDADARRRAARVSGLLLRLVAGETHDPALFPVVTSFFASLTTLPADVQDAAEVIAVLRVLAVLGFDTGDIPSDAAFLPDILETVTHDRTGYIRRINQSIAASGL